MTTATTHTLLRAEGFSCPSCVKKIEKSLDRLPGVSASKVAFETQRIEVDHDAERTSVQDLVDAVAKVGYTARPAAF
ncbi:MULTISPECIES: heavy-metal-associated domain-containing protein [Micrococcus]|uniref:Copper chaperone CopZ n=1 Tax=Micrococcus endophyticus TaxID=455343 RepID=A0A4Y8Y806_9MICC|nr:MULTISPECIES: heavy metal-associated domain-containing protein [Micrococcus]MBB5848335.1 copper chaperone CopZ [Micrococcus endophyticus]MCR8675345.1 heavy-metal-associated domain-containing protein [Micrococcus sp. HG099]TFI28787.1 heavy-metal-associated domain-containing protein [Micrococcus endophyticus]TQF75551.1 heavy-metal-associated domain-containing protein [Micrococcus sp. R8502A1]